MKNVSFNDISNFEEDFNFDKSTASIFDDMLERSVPHYDEIQSMIAEITRSLVQKNSLVYDLGCSTGTTARRILEQLGEFPVKIIGIDNSEAMIKIATARQKRIKLQKKCAFAKKDLNGKMCFKNASVIISNLTMQFVRPINRDRLVSEIYKGLNKNGAFILVDKITSKNSIMNRLFIKSYYAFKMRNGYSQSEILKKRESLENVLIPYRYEENVRLLKANGFKVEEFFRWYNFCGILAIK